MSLVDFVCLNARDREGLSGAMSRAKRAIAEAEAMPLLAHGGDRRSDEFKTEDQVTNGHLESGPNEQSRVAKRLVRDHADLFDRVKAGDLSLHKAGIEAGFVADEFSCPKDPAKAAQRLRRHFTGERFAELARAMGSRWADSGSEGARGTRTVKKRFQWKVFWGEPPGLHHRPAQA